MSLSADLDTAFNQFITNEVSNDLLKSIKEIVTVEDVDSLISSVESLGDPSKYCKNDYDSQTPTGFFLYIDFISALIIHLGGQAIHQASNFKNTTHPFVKWVVKYVEDERFHDEITSKFSEIFAL